MKICQSPQFFQSALQNPSNIGLLIWWLSGQLFILYYLYLLLVRILGNLPLPNFQKCTSFLLVSYQYIYTIITSKSNILIQVLKNRTRYKPHASFAVKDMIFNARQGLSVRDLTLLHHSKRSLYYIYSTPLSITNILHSPIIKHAPYIPDHQCLFIKLLSDCTICGPYASFFFL